MVGKKGSSVVKRCPGGESDHGRPHSPEGGSGTDPTPNRHQKPMMDLLPFGALEDVARAYQSGIEKGYEPWQWRNGSLWRGKQMAAALRHISEWMRGNDEDVESGLNPLAHAVSRLLVLLDWAKDDRFKKYDDRQNATRGPNED